MEPFPARVVSVGWLTTRLPLMTPQPVPSLWQVVPGATNTPSFGAPRLNHALRKQAEAGGDEVLTKRGTRLRLGEVAHRRGTLAAAWLTCGRGGRADREHRAVALKLDQFRVLPTRTNQIGGVARAVAVAHLGKQIELRPHTTVLRLHGQASRRREAGRLLVRVTWAIPTAVFTGAEQVQNDAARNAKVCVA